MGSLGRYITAVDLGRNGSQRSRYRLRSLVSNEALVSVIHGLDILVTNVNIVTGY